MTNDNTIEVLQRFSRRSMIASLFVVAALGGIGLALILSPEGAVAGFVNRAPWLIPVAIVIVAAVLQTSLKGRRWKPDSPEARTILEDEFRRTNMDRAARISLIVLLLAQWPLGLILAFVADLPAPRTAMAMAAASMTLGLVTLITLFLFFDRE